MDFKELTKGLPMTPKYFASFLTLAICSISANPIPKAAMQEYTKVQKPLMQIIGIACRTSNDPDRGPVEIPAHWGKFYSENILSQIPNRISNDVIALYCDYESDYTKPYSFVIGCEVSSIESIPDGMVAKVLPAATFAKYSAKGDFPQSVIDTWMHIWQSDHNRSYIGDYEVYGEKFSSSKEVDVLLAITE